MNQNFKPSKRDLQRESIRRLVICAALIALYVVINRFLTIPVSSGVKIGLSFIAPMIAGMLYGPLTGGIVYGLGDFLAAILFPQGVFHPGYTVVAFLMGAVWGLFTHPYPFGRFENRALTSDGNKKRILKALFVLCPAVINCLVLGLFLNSLWTSQLYGSKTYLGWVSARVLQEVIMAGTNFAVALAFLPVSQLLRKKGFVLPFRRKTKT